ncbi:tyrosine-type recombinase/integrase [Hellea balneolensis]|uniref:tyrosine-type recombinase/integrase n=1 Tax=Hellea balneolensis TaxID=287478 RepID=UPI0004182994|nr:site-specific integrase [Hellea balneolensis]
MTEVNPKNERLKLAWIDELEVQKAESTIDQKLAALAGYEIATGWVDFEKFSREHVTSYLEALRRLSVTTRTKAAKVRHVKDFFQWMVMDEKLKPKQARKPLLALRLTDKEQRAGRAQKMVKFATIEQITSTIAAMPISSVIDRRNRALLAFTLLSGARDGSIISMTVGHVRLAEREVIQHPDTTNTKASKHILTWFYPVGDFIEAQVAEYIIFLKDDLGFSDSDPLFPATQNGHDENDLYTPVGLTKRHWTTAQPMRKIFREAFKANGMQYYNPHSFRNTLTALAYQLKLDPMAMKAWSQNMGHEHLDTTYNSYGKLSPNAQRETMLGLVDRHKNTDEYEDTQPLTKGDMKTLLAEIALVRGIQ